MPRERGGVSPLRACKSLLSPRGGDKGRGRGKSLPHTDSSPASASNDTSKAAGATSPVARGSRSATPKSRGRGRRGTSLNRNTNVSSLTDTPSLPEPQRGRGRGKFQSPRGRGSGSRGRGGMKSSGSEAYLGRSSIADGSASSSVSKEMSTASSDDDSPLKTSSSAVSKDIKSTKPSKGDKKKNLGKGASMRGKGFKTGRGRGSVQGGRGGHSGSKRGKRTKTAEELASRGKARQRKTGEDQRRSKAKLIKVGKAKQKKTASVKQIEVKEGVCLEQVEDAPTPPTSRENKSSDTSTPVVSKPTVLEHRRGVFEEFGLYCDPQPPPVSSNSNASASEMDTAPPVPPPKPLHVIKQFPITNKTKSKRYTRKLFGVRRRTRLTRKSTGAEALTSTSNALSELDDSLSVDSKQEELTHESVSREETASKTRGSKSLNLLQAQVAITLTDIAGQTEAISGLNAVRAKKSLTKSQLHSNKASTNEFVARPAGDDKELLVLNKLTKGIKAADVYTFKGTDDEVSVKSGGSLSMPPTAASSIDDSDSFSLHEDESKLKHGGKIQGSEQRLTQTVQSQGFVATAAYTGVPLVSIDSTGSEISIGVLHAPFDGVGSELTDDSTANANNLNFNMSLEEGEQADIETEDETVIQSINGKQEGKGHGSLVPAKPVRRKRRSRSKTQEEEPLPSLRGRRSMAKTEAVDTDNHESGTNTGAGNLDKESEVALGEPLRESTPVREEISPMSDDTKEDKVDPVGQVEQSDPESRTRSRRGRPRSRRGVWRGRRRGGLEREHLLAEEQHVINSSNDKVECELKTEETDGMIGKEEEESLSVITDPSEKESTSATGIEETLPGQALGSPTGVDEMMTTVSAASYNSDGADSQATIICSFTQSPPNTVNTNGDIGRATDGSTPLISTDEHQNAYEGVADDNMLLSDTHVDDSSDLSLEMSDSSEDESLKPPTLLPSLPEGQVLGEDEMKEDAEDMEKANLQTGEDKLGYTTRRGRGGRRRGRGRKRGRGRWQRGFVAKPRKSYKKSAGDNTDDDESRASEARSDSVARMEDVASLAANEEEEEPPVLELQTPTHSVDDNAPLGVTEILVAGDTADNVTAAAEGNEDTSVTECADDSKWETECEDEIVSDKPETFEDGFAPETVPEKVKRGPGRPPWKGRGTRGGRRGKKGRAGGLKRGSRRGRGVSRGLSSLGSSSLARDPAVCDVHQDEDAKDELLSEGPTPSLHNKILSDLGASIKTDTNFYDSDGNIGLMRRRHEVRESLSGSKVDKLSRGYDSDSGYPSNEKKDRVAGPGNQAQMLAERWQKGEMRSAQYKRRLFHTDSDGPQGKHAKIEEDASGDHAVVSTEAEEEDKARRTRGKKLDWYLFSRGKKRLRKSPNQSLDSVGSGHETSDSLISSGELSVSVQEKLAQCRPCRVVIVDFIKCLDLLRQQPGDSDLLASPRPVESFNNSSCSITDSAADSEADDLSKVSTSLASLSPVPSDTEAPVKRIKLSSPSPVEKRPRRTSVTKPIESPSPTLKRKQTSRKSSPSAGAVPEPIVIQPIREETEESYNTNGKREHQRSKPIRQGKVMEKYRCLHCRYMTNVRSVMEEHIYNHTSLVPYSCGHCGAIFGTKSGVNVHTRKQHKGLLARLVKNLTNVSEEEHYTTVSHFEEMGGNVQPPPLPGTSDIHNTETTLLDSDAQSPDTPTGSSDSGAGDNSMRSDSRHPSASRSRIPIMQGADPTRPYFQCKHCTFASNDKPDIEWHVSETHSDEREIMCAYCKKTLLKGDASIRSHFSSLHPDSQVAVQFAPDYTSVFVSPSSNNSSLLPNKEKRQETRETEVLKHLSKLKPLMPKGRPLVSVYSSQRALSPSPETSAPKLKHTARKSFRRAEPSETTKPVLSIDKPVSSPCVEATEDGAKPPIILRIPMMYVREAMSSQTESASSSGEDSSPQRFSGVSSEPEGPSQSASQESMLSPADTSEAPPSQEEDEVPPPEPAAVSPKQPSPCRSSPPSSPPAPPQQPTAQAAEAEVAMDEDDDDDDANPFALKISSVVSLCEDKVEDESSGEEALSPSKSNVIRKLYSCKFCSFSTKEKAYIINHIEFVHQMDYHYTCPYCEFQHTTHKNNIVEHMEKTHPLVGDNITFDLVDQEKYFDVVENRLPVSVDVADSTGGEAKKEETDGSAVVSSEKGAPLNTARPRQGPRPVSMVGPMIKGQAFISLPQPTGTISTPIAVETSTVQYSLASQEASVSEAPIVAGAPLLSPPAVVTISTIATPTNPVLLMSTGTSATVLHLPINTRPPQMVLPARLMAPQLTFVDTSQRSTNAKAVCEVRKPPPLIPLGVPSAPSLADLTRTLPLPPLQRAPIAITEAKSHSEATVVESRPTIVQAVQAISRPLQPKQKVSPMPSSTEQDEEAAHRASFSVFNLTGPRMRDSPRPAIRAAPPGLPSPVTQVPPRGPPPPYVATSFPPTNPFPLRTVEQPKPTKEGPSDEELQKYRMFQIPRGTVLVPSLPPTSAPQPQVSNLPPSTIMIPAYPTAAQVAPPTLLNCMYCRDKLASRQELHDHLLTHRSIFWTCPYCPSTIQLKRSQVEIHIRTYHPGQKVIFRPYGV